MKCRQLACVLLGGILAANSVLRAAENEETGDDTVAAGHSYHGEAFDEGPRQKAYLMEGTSNVHFPCTSKKPLVQKFIDQGVGQLHGFWYFEAERSFRQAAAIDPDCAMAYWGMALANGNNTKRNKEFIKKAVALKDKVSERERMYIEALNTYLTSSEKSAKKKEKYLRALERISYKFPEDIEAKAFITLCLYTFRRDVPIRSYLAANALLESILDENPLHPVHHYRIHLWDYEKADIALDSAAKCGASAPGIAHMWHMPGHIYSRLKRYREGAWQQEASARVDHAHMIRDQVLPDQIHNFAHNNEWLCRNLVHTGRIGDALSLSKNMIELPRHPKYNRLDKSGCSSWYGRLRLAQVLNEGELWEESIALANSMYYEPTDVGKEQVKRLRQLGRAHFSLGQTEKGEAVLQELEERDADIKKKMSAAEDKAEAKARKDAESAKGADPKSAAFKKKLTAAIAKARSAAKRTFSSESSEIARAVNELKGRQLLAADKPKEALPLLQKASGVDAMFLCEVMLAAGKNDEALKKAEDQVKRNPHEAVPLAKMIPLYWQANQKDKAKSSFATLRKTGCDADLSARVFAKLAPIAKELGYPEDWRIAQPFPKDFGERPELDSLGPFRWHPTTAADWSLPDFAGRSHSLASYRGRPVVVIFYLGAGCLHCIEQLEAFAPKAEEFRKLGIEVVAISTDDRSQLKKSVEDYKDGEFPYLLVSDEENRVFKQYRCYDDFEDLPLHGTFLIDAAGQIRWQDIGFEPFMEPKFVLEEAARLLGKPQPQVVTSRKPVQPAVAEKQE